MPTTSLFHWRQNVPTTFNNFPVHKCISWGIFSPGRKWDIMSSWDNLSPEKCQLNNGFLIHMLEIWPKIAQDISKICASFAQGMGIQIEKVGQNVAGRLPKLGHYVAGEVHNAMGHFVVGTFCLLTDWINFAISTGFQSNFDILSAFHRECLESQGEHHPPQEPFGMLGNS